jgi:GNAT superfamily N-acetyltransferase
MIRPATFEDATALARLRYEFRASFGTVVEDESRFLARCAEWISHRLRPGGAWDAWIAEADGTAAGAIWLQWIEKIPNPVAELEWHGYISSFYVREIFRGRRLGSGLLAAALSACRARGVDAVILWPTPHSRSLYVRHGFSVRDDIMVRR